MKDSGFNLVSQSTKKMFPLDMKSIPYSKCEKKPFASHSGTSENLDDVVRIAGRPSARKNSSP